MKSYAANVDGGISAQRLDVSELNDIKLRMQVYADIEANVGCAPNTVQEAMEFIQSIPKFKRQTTNF